MSEIAQSIIEEGKRLDALKTRINEEHRQCEEAVGEALKHAINAGEGLAQMKERVPHGTWGRWLRENFEGSERTAQAYVRLYRRRDEIRNGAADLSIRGALSSLSTPKPKALTETAAEEVVIEAVAETEGVSLETARKNHADTIRETKVAVERENARREEVGESFDAKERADYAGKVAEAKKRSRAAEERYREEQRANLDFMLLDVDAHLSKARRELR